MASVSTFSAQAFDKTQMDLQKNFWGTWSVYNAQTKCTETYQFTQPAQVVYSAKQKKMTGEFSVIRTQVPNQIDVFAMSVGEDNKRQAAAIKPRTIARHKSG